MEEQQVNNVSDEISVIELIFRYLREWKMFAISVCVCLVAAYIYIVRTVPLYNSYSKIIVSDETRGQTEQDMIATFNDIGLFSDKNNLDNEIEILRSETLMQKVSDSLHLNIGYYKKIGFKTYEIYNNSPVYATIADQIETGRFRVDSLSEEKIKLTSLDFDYAEEIEFGQEALTPCGLLTVFQNPYGTEVYPIIISVNHPENLPAVSVNTMSKTSSVVEVSIITQNVQKGRDIVNTLIALYNLDAIEDKNVVAKNTIAFIEDRLKDNSSELDRAEKSVETYRRTESVMNIEEQSRHLLNFSEKNLTQINEMQTLLFILKQTKSFVSNQANAQKVIPTNNGLTDATVINLIAAYNKEISEKLRTTSGMAAINPIVRDFDRRISTIKESLLQGIDQSINTAELTISELRKQEGLNRSMASSLPTKERESRNLLREQAIQETIVKYLMQKKVETGLSLALATPKAKVVDAAKSFGPVKPRKSIIFLAALAIGLIIPVVIIYLIDLLDVKVHSRGDVTKTLTAPFIGEIPFSKDKNPLPTLRSRSFIAEKFRIIGAKLEFIVGQSDRKTKIINVTSSTPSEGKSFCSRNLALSLATTGKKTLLLDLDLRNSATQKILLDIKKEKGSTLFLADSKIKISDVINRDAYYPNFDIIPVKVYPPNPAELLSSNRLPKLFSELENLDYDYIIVDSAPYSLVSDTFIINRYSDATIFVVREDYTPKNMLHDMQELYKENKLKNVSWILNCVDFNKKYGYGYSGYGKHYYDEGKKIKDA
jgi:capsular exopolysaccharide synthesis family protein